MIEKLEFVDHKWVITFVCGYCNAVSESNVTKRDKDRVLRLILDKSWPCRYCKMKGTKNGT